MPKIVFSGNDKKKQVINGIEKAVSVVTSTYGGQGGTVLYQPLHGPATFTKDGYEVSRNIEFENVLENIGAKIVKEGCDKMAFKAGDGTTTVAALLGALVNEAYKYELAGIFPRDLMSGLRYGINEARSLLKEMAVKINNKDYASIEAIASVSSNYDENVVGFIKEAYKSINERGFSGNPVILIEESKTEHSTINIVQGMQLYRGVLTPQFFKSSEKNSMKIELNQPLVLIFGKELNLGDIQQLFPTLEQFVKQGKSFVVFAPNFTDDVVNFFTTNRHRGISDGVCVKTPGFGDGQLAIAQDIAIRTGGQVLCEHSVFLELDKVNLNEYIGTAEKVCVERDVTIIVGGNGKDKEIAERYNYLQAEYEKQGLSNYQKNQYENRISSLMGVVCVIRVGGVSEMTVKETKDRVDDTYHATKNALLYGVVPGGNIDLVFTANKLEEKRKKESLTLTKAQCLGLEILSKVLRKPFKMLMDSCNLSADICEAKVMEAYHKQGKLEYGIDVRSGELVNFITKGILNPAIVATTALTIAEDILSVFVPCKTFIGDTPEEDKGLKQGFNKI